MAEQTATTTQSPDPSQTQEFTALGHAVRGETVVGFAVLGCMVAGVIAIFKAIESDGLNSAACLVASVAAFGTVCYIYFRKN